MQTGTKSMNWIQLVALNRHGLQVMLLDEHDTALNRTQIQKIMINDIFYN